MTGDALFHRGMLATKMHFVRQAEGKSNVALEYHLTEEEKSHRITRIPSHGGRATNFYRSSTVDYQVHCKQGIPIRKGEWFGEQALWLVQAASAGEAEAPLLHQGSAIAKENVELVDFDATKFRNILLHIQHY